MPTGRGVTCLAINSLPAIRQRSCASLRNTDANKPSHARNTTLTKSPGPRYQVLSPIQQSICLWHLPLGGPSARIPVVRLVVPNPTAPRLDGQAACCCGRPGASTTHPVKRGLPTDRWLDGCGEAPNPEPGATNPPTNCCVPHDMYYNCLYLYLFLSVPYMQTLRNCSRAMGQDTSQPHGWAAESAKPSLANLKPLLTTTRSI